MIEAAFRVGELMQCYGTAHGSDTQWSQSRPPYKGEVFRYITEAQKLDSPTTRISVHHTAPKLWRAGATERLERGQP